MSELHELDNMTRSLRLHALLVVLAAVCASSPSAQSLCTAITVTATPTKTAPINSFFTRDGGTAFVYVQGSTPGCTWTASTGAPWITFPDGSSGAGTGWFRYAVAATTISRQATITITANQVRSFSVLQDAQSPHGSGTVQSPAGWTASPSTATVAQPFRLTGFAFDDRSTTGTGVTGVDLYWVDNTGFHALGPATYGLSHPHVSESLGSRYENSGWEIQVTGLPTTATPNASVSLQAFARSAVDASVLAAGATRVTIGAPAVDVSPSTLQFAATSTSGIVTTATGAQSIALKGFGWPSGWTATRSAPWMVLSASSGAGPARFDVSIDKALVPPSGMLIGDIQISVPDVPGGLVTLPVRVDAYPAGVTGHPFGAFDPPPTPTSGAVPLTGWALDDVGVDQVAIYRSRGATESSGAPIFIGYGTFVDGARPDVALAYPSSPRKTRAGWGYMLLSNVLPGTGNETWTFFAYAIDVEGRQTFLGMQDVALTNNVAEVPFGALDFPASGETVSGVYTFAGWAVSPRPGQITLVNIYLDGQSIGTTRYGLARPDVAALFSGPTGPVDAATPGFQFTLDTRGLANGLHTLAVVAFSNMSGAAGLGSRYFVVSNP